jgi:hypothetical protein
VRSSLLLKLGIGARFKVLNALKRFARNSKLAFSPSKRVVGNPNCFARLKSTCLKLGPGNELRPIGGPPRGNAVVKTREESGARVVKIKGECELAICLTSIATQGHTYQIQTNVLSSTIKGKGKRTAATTGGGAAGGALIGGLAGGGKGAGIGVLVGATGGFLGGAFTGNKQIEIPGGVAAKLCLNCPVDSPTSRQMIPLWLHSLDQLGLILLPSRLASH